MELFEEMGRASSKGATRSGFASAARGARSNGAKTGRIVHVRGEFNWSGKRVRRCAGGMYVVGVLGSAAPSCWESVVLGLVRR